MDLVERRGRRLLLLTLTAIVATWLLRSFLPIVRRRGVVAWIRSNLIIGTIEAVAVFATLSLLGVPAVVSTPLAASIAAFQAGFWVPGRPADDALAPAVTRMLRDGSVSEEAGR